MNMKAPGHAQTLEATRLTRAGQLMEAVSLLQRMFGSDGTHSTTPEDSSGARLMEAPTIGGRVRHGCVLQNEKGPPESAL